MAIDIQDPRITRIEKYGYLEPEPKIIAYCDGCGEGIYEGQDIYEFEDVILHQDSQCCEDYIGHFAITKVAGE